MQLKQSYPLDKIYPSGAVIADYVNGSPRLAPYFAHFPPQTGQAVNIKPSISRSDLARFLADYNSGLGASPLTRDNIRLLEDDRTLVVMTGQQPGLLTGPLYTIYKTVSVLRLSRDLARETGRPCVPVFWIAGEDHDHSEVNNLSLPDKNCQPLRLEISVPENYQGWPGGNLPIELAQDILRNLTQALPDTEFKTQWLDLMNNLAGQSSNLGEWFARIMQDLFGKYGLVLVDANHPRIRQLMRPLVAGSLKDPQLAGRMANRAGDELERLGYRRQLRRLPQACDFFMFEDGKRQRLDYRDGHYHTAQADYSIEDLKRILEQNPERFSPSAAIRPIAADYLFGTAVYVGGPGEIGYFSQLKAVYEHFGVDMPLIMPRISLTLVESHIQKILDKHSLEPFQFYVEADRVIENLVRRESEFASEELWKEIRSQALEPLNRLSSRLGQNSAEERLVETARNKIAWQLDQLEAKVLQEQKRKGQAGLSQLNKARQCLFPDGHLQERVLNAFYFLTKYGRAWLDGLFTGFPPDYRGHQVLEIQG